MATREAQSSTLTAVFYCHTPDPASEHALPQPPCAPDLWGKHRGRKDALRDGTLSGSSDKQASALLQASGHRRARRRLVSISSSVYISVCMALAVPPGHCFLKRDARPSLQARLDFRPTDALDNLSALL